MSELRETTVQVNGEPCRVWAKGSGEPLFYLAGLGGLRHWSPFLDALAEQRRVVAPSLPGLPGSAGHDRLDDLLDWISATLDLLEAAGLEGADLVGASLGGALACEIAALSPALLKRLVLIAPFGLWSESEPVTDCWAQRPGTLPSLLVRDAERLAASLAVPEGADEIEWQVQLARAAEAGARLLWPTTDTGVRKRLHRIRVPTLLLWGSADQVIPASYAKRFAEGIAGPVQLQSIAGAGHLADFDEPEACARAVLEFLS